MDRICCVKQSLRSGKTISHIFMGNGRYKKIALAFHDKPIRYIIAT
ncbi:hypothetical protein TREPR_1874 [Treponema primitia ZAS-2]|uniref:Transposase n=1 Tax=Treponema primitia (strain ATCC BAA-887 / DSM 12427 / ZAS-2) TaxID=545694 RepID=F5YL56_TREPZ|nr:hypothetical protein TREPR_1874 [Treponema primitia ZAS-2]